MIAGVGQGLARASGLDVTVVRICIGLSLLAGPLGWIGYGLLWIVLPDEQPSRGRVIEPAPENTARIIRFALVGAALIGVLRVVGGVWPFTNGSGHTTFGFDGIFGLILLSVGIGVLFSRHRPDRGMWEASPPPTAAPIADPVDDDTISDDAVSFVGPFADAATQVHTSVASAVKDARSGEWDSDWAESKPKSGAALGWARALGWFVLLWWLAGALAFAALWRFDAIDVTAPVVVGVAAWLAFTAVISVLLRVRQPSAVVASLLVLLVPVVLGSALSKPDGPVGSRILRPERAAATATYRHAIGKLELDFSTTRFRSGTTEITTHTGVGATLITVPNNVSVTAITKAKTGGYAILGREADFGIGQRETLRFAGCEGAPHLRIILEQGAGWMEVKRANENPNATCPAPA